MVIDQEIIKITFLFIFIYWLLVVGRRLWFSYQKQIEKNLIVLLKNQAEIIEGLSYYLLKNENRIDRNSWNIIFVDFGSDDETLSILLRLQQDGKISWPVYAITAKEKNIFLKKLAKDQPECSQYVLQLESQADGRKALRHLDKILANDKHAFELAQIQYIEHNS
ncbi:MAG: hypothetical protein SCK28_05210 [Bacillota bacterium]|nr:hypothetical protein [Bacillota bacterium]